MSPTAEEIRQARDVDLRYEIEQFAWCAIRILDNHWWTVQDVPLQSAVLESLLVHVRGLLDFLSRKHRRDRDVLPTDLAANWAPRKLPPCLDTEKRRLDQQLAHLTYARPMALDKKGWDVGSLVRAVLPKVRDFCQAAGTLFPPLAQQVLVQCEGPGAGGMSLTQATAATAVSHSWTK